MPPVNRKEEKDTLLEDIPKGIEVILGKDMVKTASVANAVTNRPRGCEPNEGKKFPIIIFYKHF